MKQKCLPSMTESAHLCLSCAGTALLRRSSVVTNVLSGTSVPWDQALDWREQQVWRMHTAAPIGCTGHTPVRTVGTCSVQDLAGAVPEVCHGRNGAVQWAMLGVAKDIGCCTVS